MWRSKKVIVGAVLAAVMLLASIGGAAMADTGDGSGLKAKFGEYFDRVCEIYEENTGVAIDQEALRDAFTQARGEMCPEALQDGRMIDPEAMQERLQNLVGEGRITQEQADKMIERWESVTDGGEGFGFKGRVGFHGMGGMRGFGGLCAPAE